MELYSRISKPHSTSRDFWDRWRKWIVAFSVGMGALFLTWLFLFLFWAHDLNSYVLLDQIIEGVINALFLGAGFGFLLFGILLFLQIKRISRLSIGGSSSSSTAYPLLLKKKRAISSAPPEAVRAAVVGSICTVCFCFRSVISLYSIHQSIADPSKAGEQNFNLGWEFQLAYFVISEMIPTILMMFRLRKMKKRKPLVVNDVYAQYSPITASNPYAFGGGPNNKNISIPNTIYNNTTYYSSSSSSSSSHQPYSSVASSIPNSFTTSSTPNISNNNNNNNNNRGVDNQQV
eukprot:gene1100-1396_t